MTDNRLDVCLELVADRLRRGTIQSVRAADGREMTVVELVDTLHGTEPITVSTAGPEPTIDARGTPERHQIHLQLVHTHLPKLAEHDVVEFDRERGVVRYRSDEQIERLLDTIVEEFARVTH